MIQSHILCFWNEIMYSGDHLPKVVIACKIFQGLMDERSHCPEQVVLVIIVTVDPVSLWAFTDKSERTQRADQEIVIEFLHPAILTNQIIYKD